MKYGKFTPEEDALLLPWVNKGFLISAGVNFGTLDIPYHVTSEIAEKLMRPRSAVVNRIRYLRQKRHDEKERMERHFSYRDVESAHKIKDVYRKQSRHARIYFLSKLIPADELAEAQKRRPELVVTTAEILSDQKQLPAKNSKEGQ